MTNCLSSAAPASSISLSPSTPPAISRTANNFQLGDVLSDHTNGFTVTGSFFHLVATAASESGNSVAIAGIGAHGFVAYRKHHHI